MQSADQMSILDRRLNSLGIHFPLLFALKEKLTKIAGEMIVPSEDSDLHQIINEVNLLDKYMVRLEPGVAGQCHRNVAHYSATKGYRICTGWALSDDGLWHQHSWCLAGNELVETTVKRQRYFGIFVDGKDAEVFMCNL
jgi:hypothetical protein